MAYQYCCINYLVSIGLIIAIYHARRSCNSYPEGTRLSECRGPIMIVDKLKRQTPPHSTGAMMMFEKLGRLHLHNLRTRPAPTDALKRVPTFSRAKALGVEVVEPILPSRTAVASCVRFSGPYNVVWRDDSGLDPLQRVRCFPPHIAGLFCQKPLSRPCAFWVSRSLSLCARITASIWQSRYAFHAT